MKNNEIRGVWTALITPFDEKDQLDLPAFKKLLHFQVSAGVAGVIPCGSTGEGVTLSEEERKILITTSVQELKGTGVKVFAGIGTNHTAETRRLAVWSAEQGVDGLLVVTPYYNKPSQAGLEAHFRAVADAVQCDVMLYNVPGRTGVSLLPETVANLAAHPRIRALKEATGKVEFTSEILDALAVKNRSIAVLSGDDLTFLPLLSVGAVGVVSVVSNLIPEVMVSIQKAMDAGNGAEAEKLHLRYFPLFRDLFIESNPMPLKHAMSYVGKCKPQLRLPLVPISKANAEKLDATLKRCGIVG